METNGTKYRPLLLVVTFLVAAWGVLGIFDVSNQTSNGYQTDDNNIVTQITENSPAERCGLQVGDHILNIGGISVEDAKSLARQPRAEIGETRTLVIERNGEQASMELTYVGVSLFDKALAWMVILIGFSFLLGGLWAFQKTHTQSGLLLTVVGIGLGLALFDGPYIKSYNLRTLFTSVRSIVEPFGFAALVHFMLSFPRRKAFLRKPYALKLIYGVAFVFGLLLLYMAALQPAAAGGIVSLFHLLFAIFVAGYLGWAMGVMLHSYLTATPEERIRNGLNLLLVGTLGGLSPILVLLLISFFAPRVVTPATNFFLITMVLIPLFLALAVSKQQRAL